MLDFLNALNQYAQLINFGLFATIVGWLFLMSQQYKESSKQKLDIELSTKDSEIKDLQNQIQHNKRERELLTINYEQQISSLKDKLETQESHHQIELKVLQGEIKGLQNEINHFKFLMSDVVQKKLKELEQEEKNASVEEIVEIREQKSQLQNSLERLKNIDYSLVAAVLQVAIPILISGIKFSFSNDAGKISD